MITEAELQRQVTDLASILGWQWVHFRPAQTRHGWRTPVSGPLGEGWPDLVLVRGPDIVFVELKRSDRDQPTAKQLRVLSVLSAVGPTLVVRPADVDDLAEALR